MEEQSERKAATTVSEEPIKAEGAVGSPESDRSDGASSPPPNCSICLGKLINTSFTDSCLHQFCFTCLLQWSKIKTECPLCKQTFKSIIHNVRSEEDYDQYHVPRELASQVAAATLDVNFDIVGVGGVGTMGRAIAHGSLEAISSNWDIGVRRFMYRSTLGNPNRRMGMLINPHEVARREQLPSIAPQLSRDERRSRQINPSDFRRNVYRHGVWASPLPDVFGRFRECSAELYRRQPAEINRLIPWLNRELQVLLNNNAPHVAYVLRVISDALSRYDIRSTEFRNLVRPYFGIHTEHFAHELANFARTSFDMVGYDQSVMYLPSRGFTNEYVPRILSPVSSSSSMTSDDSDVRVVDETVERRGLNIRFSAVMPHSIDMPGPSTVGRAFLPYIPMISVPDVVTVSSSSSGSEDECEVIGYVKPRHERTPEIIDLSNSETEEPKPQPNENKTLPLSIIVDENQPSTSQEVKRQSVRKLENGYPSRMLEILSSSTYSESDSDSDYSPKRRHKVSSKKSKRLSRNLQTRKRKRSTTTKSAKIDRILSTNAFYSSSDSDSKHTKRPPKKESKRRRLSVSTDSSSEKIKKRNPKSKSRKIKHASSAAPKDNQDVKRETVASNSDSETHSSSGSNTEEKPRDQRKSRRSYSSSSDSNTARSRSSSKSKEKSRETQRTSNKSGTRNSRLKKSEIQSESESTSDSEEIDRSKLTQYPSCSDCSEERTSQAKSDLRNSLSKVTTENEELMDKMLGYEETSTDPSVEGLEQHRYYRSRSQCSVCSDNTRTSKKKSKYKDKRVKSSIKFFRSWEENSSSSSAVSSSSKNDAPSTSKHSDSKSSSSSRSRNKHRSHKKNKDSKRRRSRSNSRSKSKKKSSRQIVIDFQI